MTSRKFATQAIPRMTVIGPAIEGMLVRVVVCVGFAWTVNVMSVNVHQPNSNPDSIYRIPDSQESP